MSREEESLTGSLAEIHIHCIAENLTECFSERFTEIPINCLNESFT